MITATLNKVGQVGHGRDTPQKEDTATAAMLRPTDKTFRFKSPKWVKWGKVGLTHFIGGKS